MPVVTARVTCPVIYRHKLESDFIFQADDDYSSDEEEVDPAASPGTIRRIAEELAVKRKKEQEARAAAAANEEPSDMLRIMRSLRGAMELPKSETPPPSPPQVRTYDEVVELNTKRKVYMSD